MDVKGIDGPYGDCLWMRWKGVSIAGLFCSSFGQFISHVLSTDVCVGFDFANGNIVVGGF